MVMSLSASSPNSAMERPRSLARSRKTSPAEMSSRWCFSAMERARVVVPLPGGPLIVTFVQIPPMFMDFRITWLMQTEQIMYQRIQAGTIQMAPVQMDISPKYGKVIFASRRGSL